MRPAAAAFLRRAGWGAARAEPLAGDASTRQFWRLVGGPRPAVLMDDPGGASAAFLRVAVLLRSVGLLAPAIYRAELPHLLIVEDFGDETFSALLDRGAPAAPLLADAVDVLVALHRRFRAPVAGLPVFDADRFAAQAGLFVEICAPDADRAAFEAAWRAALAPALALPNSLLLRDYFAGNLIRVGDRTGLLDLQDAGLGPVAYDLASLLFDARRDYDPADVEAAIGRYLAAFPALDATVFRRGLAILTAQRDMRIVAIFKRLAATGKPHYLAHLPRVTARLRRLLAAEPALAPVAAWLAQAGDEVL
jgi:aminoglycoside/choline kinase family phosphotransferase